MAFSYSISGVSDLDQRWDSLPANGSMYCVPTSAMNWMYYLTNTGQANAVPFGVNVENLIPFNIANMGSYMDTDAEDGTGTSDAVDGLVDWCDDFGVPACIICKSAGDGDHVTYAGVRNMLKYGGHITVAMGRYRLDDGELERRSGHAMTLVRFRRRDTGEITIGVHNPAMGDSDLDDQSGVQRQNAGLVEGTFNLEGDFLKGLRWGNDTTPYRIVDGWHAIVPMFSLTNISSGALTSYKFDFKTGKVIEGTILLPFEGEITDLALDAPSLQASVVHGRSGDVWTLDLADEVWTKVGGVKARRVAYGGHPCRLFALTDREVISIDDQGSVVDKLDVGVGVDAITYDQKHDRLVVLSSDSKRLISIDPSLKTVDEAEAPAVPGSGRLALSVNGSDGTITITRDGSADAATVRWHRSGAMAKGNFRLLASGPVSAAHVNRKGHVYVSEAGKIATFDKDGNRIATSHFDGLKAGRLLKFARSSRVFDVAKSRRKEWRS